MTYPSQSVELDHGTRIQSGLWPRRRRRTVQALVGRSRQLLRRVETRPNGCNIPNDPPHVETSIEDGFVSGDFRICECLICR